MRADPRAALLLAAALALPASALDAGSSVTFGASRAARFPVRVPLQGIVFDSGASDPVAGEWDTVLIQGESPDPAVTFLVSRLDSKGGWTPWTSLAVERRAGGRFWGKASTALFSGALRLRAVSAGALKDHEVKLFGIEVFSSRLVEPSAPSVPAQGPSEPPSSRPPVHDRSEWGALAPAEPYSPDPLPWRITLHHTDGRLPATLAGSLEEARFIQDFHMRGRGWNDIGYHYMIDPLGDIIEGRREGVQGAHTLANNEGNIGIALMGSYHPPKNNVPTQAQIEALARLGRYLVLRYGIAPDSLSGHRDYFRTDCPGDLSYPLLAALRQAFAGGPVPVPSRGKTLLLKAPALAALPDWDGSQR